MSLFFTEQLKEICPSIDIFSSMDERFIMQAECDHQKFIFVGYVSSKIFPDFVKRIRNFHIQAREQNLIAS